MTHPEILEAVARRNRQALRRKDILIRYVAVVLGAVALAGGFVLFRP